MKQRVYIRLVDLYGQLATLMRSMRTMLHVENQIRTKVLLDKQQNGRTLRDDSNVRLDDYIVRTNYTFQ